MPLIRTNGIPNPGIGLCRLRYYHRNLILFIDGVNFVYLTVTRERTV